MLNTRQKRFARAFLKSGDALSAWVEAGYSERTAKNGTKRLLAMPQVQQYISRRLQEGGDACAIADAPEILRYLTALLRGEGSDRERLRAAELLGKRHGLFSEKTVADAAAVTIVDDIDG